MRICLAGDASSIHLSRLARSLAEHGIDVSIVSIGSNPDIAGVENYEIVQLSHARTLRYPLLFRRKIRRMSPDILHAHYVPEYGFYSAFARTHPFIVHAWGSDIYVSPKASWLASFKTKYALKSADLVIADAQDLASAIGKFGIDADRIRVIPFGVDVAKFAPRKSLEFRRQLGLVHKLIIVSTRSLSPLYGVEYLIDASPHVISKSPNAHFLIVGKGPLEIELRSRAKSLGVEQSFTFLGHLPHERIPEILQTADIYVSTSLTDSTSVSLLEAMSCGVPSIVTNLPGNLEWIRDYENGIIIPPEDGQALADAIIKLLQDVELRQRLGSAARKTIQERADWERNVQEMIRVYEFLLEHHSRS